MTVKQRALAALETMPDDAGWPEALERIHMMAGIEIAEAEIAAGEGIPQAEAEARIQSYLTAIDEGLRDVEAGRLVPHEEVRRQIHAWAQRSSGPSEPRTT